MARYWLFNSLAMAFLCLTLPGLAWADDAENEKDYGISTPRSAVVRSTEEPADEPTDESSDAPAEAASDDAADEPQPLSSETRESDIDAGTAEASDAGAQPQTEHSAIGNRTVEVIRERYADGNIKVKREVTQDDEGNYVNHGPWSMWDPRGQLVAEGQYAGGKREGMWNRWHQRDDSPLLNSFPFNQFVAPFVSQASFKNGQLDGKWAIFDGKQRKVTEWEFANGERHGKSTWYYATGRKLREMTYAEGAIDGEAVEWNTANEISGRETYQGGRKLAPKTVYHGGNQKKTEGMYLFAKIVVKTPDDWWTGRPAVFTSIGKDEKHGVWNAWYPAGQPQMRGEYKNDVEVGQFVWWFPNGQKALEGNYDNGRQHGQWTWWHKNGQKSTQGSYAQGEQSGRWVVWHEDGRVGQAAEHFPSGNLVKENVGKGTTPTAPEQSAARDVRSKDSKDR